ncbi:MAG: glycosyltransferase [Pirellulaceae bacterium]|nr:glycosyltransferase [Pirellulaceae bacterium]
MEFPTAASEGLVSIVIPTYRADDYIGQALATIAGQEYRHWELIVVEDASRGKTESIVKEFARDQSQHRVIYLRNEKNSGPSHSRNVAFQEAHGEFVALLDADDRWMNGHLAAAVAMLRGKQADLAYSSVVMIEDQTELLLGMWGPTQQELDDFPHGLFSRNYITPSATVFRRSVIADVGLWSVNLRLCEDLDFWLRCLSAGKRFAHFGGCHCLYRQNRPEAATRNKCAVQDALAHVVERYIGLPGTSQRTCRNRVSRAFGRAARFHLQGDSRQDPSRDLGKVPALLFKAWKLQPLRVDYFMRAAWRSTLGSLHKPAPPLASLPASLENSLA